jgi:hypothetical protein
MLSVEEQMAGELTPDGFVFGVRDIRKSDEKTT